MIVTRKRRKPFRLQKYMPPLAAVGLIVLAFIWMPSHNAIFNGPLAPMWRALGSTSDRVVQPLHFVRQNAEISQKEQQIISLQRQIAADRTQTQTLNKQLTMLQTQLNESQQQQALERGRVAPKSTAIRSAAGAFGDPASAESDLSTSATPDLRRTANEWGSMDAENAAKVVQRLPISYVARVFAVIPSDAVGQILDNLSPAYAAQLTQEHPELRL